MAEVLNEADQLLIEMVAQACHGEEEPGTGIVYDSVALTTYYIVFNYLVEAGLAEFVGEQYGRRCFIRLLWPETPDYPPASSTSCRRLASLMSFLHFGSQ